MRKSIRFLFWICLMGLFLYTINERYNISSYFLMKTESLTESEREEVFVAKVREAMLLGEETLEIHYVGDVESMEWFTEEVIDRVYHIDEDETSGDYDYLRYKANSIYAHIVGFLKNMTISYEFEYNETAEETYLVDQFINKLFDKWDITNLSDYDKIKKIHDFIIENASYDTDTKKYSAYDNLMNKRSTCQGYMSAAYKMFTEAGIPCRIITGTGNKDSHGWNIVKLDGKWYNIDCTWDDPLTSNGESIIAYDYFLKSDADFPGHQRDAEFSTAEFYETYIMSETSYKGADGK